MKQDARLMTKAELTRAKKDSGKSQILPSDFFVLHKGQSQIYSHSLTLTIWFLSGKHRERMNKT